LKQRRKGAEKDPEFQFSFKYAIKENNIS
jgi:hypothetical protein